jgi:hypothetical protein
MIEIICVILFSVLILFACYYRSVQLKNIVIESFQEKDEMFHISPADKSKYFEIIDTYQMLLNRDPDKDELNLRFNELKVGRKRIEDIVVIMKKSNEYRRINDDFDNKSHAPANTSTEFQERRDFDIMLEKQFHNHEFGADFTDYIYSQYLRFDKNARVLKEYVKNTQEFQTYKNNNGATEEETYIIENITEEKEHVMEYVTEEFVERIEPTSPNNMVEIESDVSLQLDRPNTGMSSDGLSTNGLRIIIEEHKLHTDETKEISCKNSKEQPCGLKESHALSDTQAKRNIDALNYHCDMSKDYINVDSNLTLLKGQEWTVPQKHAPICYSQSCDVRYLTEQTSLIGTLLDDVDNNSKILPTFSFEEM